MGAWIEIIEWAILSNIAVLSHPTMGAWIEIATQNIYKCVYARWSHPTMGAWIEILLDSAYVFHIDSRTPRWVRGLK